MAPRFFAPRSSGFAHRFEHMPKQVTTGVTAREPTELDKAVLEQPTFMGEFWSGPPANRPRARKEMFAAEVRRRKHILAWIKDAEREVIGGAGATATPRDERAIAAGEEKNEIDLMKVDKEFLEAQLSEKDKEVGEARTRRVACASSKKW